MRPVSYIDLRRRPDNSRYWITDRTTHDLRDGSNTVVVLTTPVVHGQGKVGSLDHVDFCDLHSHARRTLRPSQGVHRGGNPGVAGEPPTEKCGPQEGTKISRWQSYAHSVSRTNHTAIPIGNVWGALLRREGHEQRRHSEKEEVVRPAALLGGGRQPVPADDEDRQRQGGRIGDFSGGGERLVGERWFDGGWHDRAIVLMGDGRTR